MGHPEPFVFHGGIFPFQARVGGSTPTTHVRGEVALPSVGGDFFREDGPWVLPAIGGSEPGRIAKVKRHVRGEGNAEKSTTRVECTIFGLKFPRVAATEIHAELISTFEGDQHTFDAKVKVESLQIDGQFYEVNESLLLLLQGKPAAAIRGMTTGEHAANFAPPNGPGSNLACFVVKPAEADNGASDVVVGEYSIGERDRRLTMLRIGLPASTSSAAGGPTSRGSVVLLQLFVNGHKPP